MASDSPAGTVNAPTEMPTSYCTGEADVTIGVNECAYSVNAPKRLTVPSLSLYCVAP
jgi:hypothetical protein